MTTLDQRTSIFGSIWEYWVRFVEIIDKRKSLSVQEWIDVLNILEDSNRDLDISYKDHSEILEIVRSQNTLLKKLKDKGDFDIFFSIAMSREQYQICLQVLNQ
jgi:hypothetical protein